MRMLLTVPLLLLLSGCWGAEVKDSDRQLNRQNAEAGRFIETKADDPQVKQAGRDVKSNALTLEKNVIGPPDNPKPYSPAASQEARDSSDKEHSIPWWHGLLIGVGSVLATVLGQGWLAGLLPHIFGGPLKDVAVSAVESITRVRDRIKANGGTMALNEETFLGIIQEAQKDERVKGLIQNLAHKAEEKLAKRM